MSQQVIGNPQEMRNFAAGLKQYSIELQEATRRINGQCNQLGDTWRDQEYQKFVEEWQKTSQTLSRFFESIVPQYVRHVNLKAQRLEDYLHQL